MRIPSRPSKADPITDRGSFPSRAYQVFFDDVLQRLNDFLLGDYVRIPSYTVAKLPTVPPSGVHGLIYVSDEAGGPIVAFSDGTNWRRVTDRAIVS